MGKIRFIHIPKTGGSSLDLCLKSIYKGKRFKLHGVFNLDNTLTEYREMDYQRRKRITFITGHAQRITGNADIDSFPIITILRNPIDRVKSFCQHVSEGKSPHLLGQFSPDKFNLNELLNSGDKELSNLQTKMLLGEGSYVLPEIGKTTLAEKAIKILENDIECFGIFEEFENSLLLFKHRLGWKKWPVYRKRNVKNKLRLITFSASQMAKIRELNDIDMQVYEGARKLFFKRINEAPHFKSKIVLFKSHQSLSVLFFKSRGYLRKIKRLISHSA